jgi:hypothetical protein
MRAHETDRALHVFDGGGIVEPRRAAVIDGEHRVSRRQQRRTPQLDLRLLDRAGAVLGRRLEAAARHEDQAMTIRFRRPVDIQQQRGAGHHAVDDVAFHRGRPGRFGGSADGGDQQQGKAGQHTHAQPLATGGPVLRP